MTTPARKATNRVAQAKSRDGIQSKLDEILILLKQLINKIGV
jgi:hypothetical protein